MATAKKSFALFLAAAILVAFMPFAGGIGFANAASKPAKVKGFTGTKTNQMVDLKWSKARGAKKYQVYMKMGKGKWKLKKTLKASKRKIKINGLKWNKKYYFKVRAVNGKRKGKFSRICWAKIGSKKTLANYLTTAKMDTLAEEMLDAVNSDETICEGCRTTVSGNHFTYKLYLISDYDGIPTATLESALKKSFSTTSKKKTMSNAIKADQNRIGIVGITYTISFYKSDESHIYSITYKKL